MKQNKQQLTYQPEYQNTARVVSLVAQIIEQLCNLEHNTDFERELLLRKVNRVASVQGSLAIEGNTLTVEQITAIFEGKRVAGSQNEVLEAQNALAAYDQLNNWSPYLEADLLQAHGLLAKGLVEQAGMFRTVPVAAASGRKIIHSAPSPDAVPWLVVELLDWASETNDHPLVASSAFYYRLEYIRPFVDGNGRAGRLWQTLLLSKWRPIFEFIPVESMVFKHQRAYYQAIKSSSEDDCTPFIEFMLEMILAAIVAANPQVSPQSSPQVEKLLRVLDGAMSREQLMVALRLHDRKSFRERYLAPALRQGLIEMTVPDKPNSPTQRYRSKI